MSYDINLMSFYVILMLLDLILMLDEAKTEMYSSCHFNDV